MDPTILVDSVVAASEVQSSAKYPQEKGDFGESRDCVNTRSLSDVEVDVLGVLLDHVVREALAVVAGGEGVQLELALEEDENRLHRLLLLCDGVDQLHMVVGQV